MGQQVWLTSFQARSLLMGPVYWRNNLLSNLISLPKKFVHLQNLSNIIHFHPLKRLDVSLFSFLDAKSSKKR